MRIGAEHINKLIDELKVNDSKPAGEYDVYLKEPKAAMEELVKLGEVAVEPLIALLENHSKYSCLYAINILGEIRDPKAVQPILGVLSSDEFHDNFEMDNESDQPIIALHKIGMPALEPTLQYLKTELENIFEPGICIALKILAGVKDEKSFSALVEMLYYHSEELEFAIVQPTAISLLGEYGDRRAVEHLMKLLENKDTREYAINSIRKLASTQEYRKIIAPYTPEHLDEFREKIELSLRELEYAHEYPLIFEGDNSDQVNFFSEEYKIGTNTYELLNTVIDLALYEGVISDEEHKRLGDIATRLRRRLWKLEDKYKEEKDIIARARWYIPGKVVTEEIRTYKGLASETPLSDYSKLEKLRSATWEWLKTQNFRVLKRYDSFYARKGRKNKRKGCSIYIRKEGQRRIWGIVHLILWGEGWTTNQALKFNKSFWQHTYNIVAELVDKKKLQIETLKE